MDIEIKILKDILYFYIEKLKKRYEKKQNVNFVKIMDIIPHLPLSRNLHRADKAPTSVKRRKQKNHSKYLTRS